MDNSTTRSKLQVSGNQIASNLEKTDMMVSPSLSTKIMKLLLLRLYSEKEGAVIREVISNAYDAHCEAGLLDRPPEISLPTKWQPSDLRIRDFGFSMSHEFMMKEYCLIGFSSKEDDMSQIGAFGLGRLTPLLICDQYIVLCTRDGITRTYVVALQEEGVPTILYAGEAPAEGEQGTEIRIPLNVNDRDAVSKIENAICRWTRGFSPLPKVNRSLSKAMMHVPPELLDYARAESTKGYGYSCQNPSRHRSEAEIILRGPMGGCCYPLDILKDGMGRVPLMASFPILIPFEIGEIDLTPSRESIELTPRTESALRERLLLMEKELTTFFRELFESFPTLWEASICYRDVSGILEHINFVPYHSGTKVKREYSLPDDWRLLEATESSGSSGNPHVRRLEISPRAGVQFCYADIPDFHRAAKAIVSELKLKSLYVAVPVRESTHTIPECDISKLEHLSPVPISSLWTRPAPSKRDKKKTEVSPLPKETEEPTLVAYRWLEYATGTPNNLLSRTKKVLAPREPEEIYLYVRVHNGVIVEHLPIGPEDAPDNAWKPRWVPVPGKPGVEGIKDAGLMQCIYKILPHPLYLLPLSSKVPEKSNWVPLEDVLVPLLSEKDAEVREAIASQAYNLESWRLYAEGQSILDLIPDLGDNALRRYLLHLIYWENYDVNWMNLYYYYMKPYEGVPPLGQMREEVKEDYPLLPYLTYDSKQTEYRRYPVGHQSDMSVPREKLLSYIRERDTLLRNGESCKPN